MSQDQDKKSFSAEDLALLKDDTTDDTDDKASDDTTLEAPVDKVDDKAIEDKNLEKDAKGSRGTLFDDDGDDTETEEEDEDTEGKDDKEEKKEEKPVTDWREKFIDLALKGQETKLTAAKLEKRRDGLMRAMSRYKSQEDYMLAGLAAQEKLRTGEYKRATLPDDATEEEILNWRKENGIPEKPESYEIPKVAGYKWSEVDDPYINSFKTVAHESNMTQAQMNEAAKWYAATVAEQQNVYLETIANQDRSDTEELDDKLRASLGPSEYKPSRQLVGRFLKDEENGFGKIRTIIMSARYQDDEGKTHRLINHPDFTNRLIDLSRETYGDAAMISGDARVTMSDRKREIEKVMDADINDYYRQGLDKEYSEILQREAKASGRRGAR
jgi:hypothetical protein